MSNTHKALEKYTAAVAAVKAHKEANKAIFDEHQRLLEVIIEAENVLRDEVQESKSNVENGIFKVSYSPVFRKFYDGSMIMEKATPAQKKALIEHDALHYEVDKDQFDRLVAQGIVPVQLKQDAYREEEKNPRITIREIKQA